MRTSVLIFRLYSTIFCVLLTKLLNLDYRLDYVVCKHFFPARGLPLCPMDLVCYNPIFCLSLWSPTHVTTFQTNMVEFFPVVFYDTVSGLTCPAVILSELTFGHSPRPGSISFFCRWRSNLLDTIYWKAFPFITVCFW